LPSVRIYQLLSDRVYHSARETISYWHHNVICLSVYPSVRLSVTLCIVAKRYVVQQKCLKKMPS